MRGRRGYSLAELILAISVASLVLVGTMMVTSSAIRFSIVGNLRSDLAGTAAYAHDQLQKDIENATYLQYPGLSGNTNNKYLSGCTNYSSRMVGADPRYDRNTVPASCPSTNPTCGSVTAFYYCVASVGSPSVQSLLRYQTFTAANVGPPWGCPYSPAPSCGTGSYTVVAREFFHVGEKSGGTFSGPDYFTLNLSTVAYVELNYVIGVATNSSVAGWTNANVPAGSGLYTPTPQYLMVNTMVRLNAAANTLGTLDIQ